MEIILQKPEGYEFNKDDNILSLKYYFPKSRIPFRIIWRLKECDREQVRASNNNNFEEKTMIVNFYFQYKNALSLPLLKANFEKNNQIEELIEIIRRKDIEIEQYKLEGGKLSRQILETEKFNESLFRTKMNNDEFFTELRNITKKDEHGSKETSLTSPIKSKEYVDHEPVISHTSPTTKMKTVIR